MGLVLPAHSEMGSKHLNWPEEDCCCQKMGPGNLPGATAAAQFTEQEEHYKQPAHSALQTVAVVRSPGKSNCGVPAITIPVGVAAPEQQQQPAAPAGSLANFKHVARLDAVVQPTSPQRTPCSDPFAERAAKRARMSRLNTTTYAFQTPNQGILCKDSGVHVPASVRPGCTMPESPRACRRSGSPAANPFAWSTFPDPIPEDALAQCAAALSMPEDNFLAPLLPAPLPFSLPVPLLNRPMFAAQANPALLMMAAAGMPALPGLEFLSVQQQPLLDDAALQRLTSAPYLANAPTTAARRLMFGQDVTQAAGAEPTSPRLGCPWNEPPSPASSCCSVAPPRAAPTVTATAGMDAAKPPTRREATGQVTPICTAFPPAQNISAFDWLFEDAREASTRQLAPLGGPAPPPPYYSPRTMLAANPCMGAPPSLEGPAAVPAVLSLPKAVEPIFGLSLKVRVTPRARIPLTADLCMPARPGTPAACC